MTDLVTADLIGRAVYHRSGAYLGRVADLVVAPDPEGTWRLTHLVVSRPPWGRLLRYERDEETGPWLLVVLARWLLRGNTLRVRWREVRIGEDDPHA
jgi:sporulation protein YlmC with PRC-barrel domain